MTAFPSRVTALAGSVRQAPRLRYYQSEVKHGVEAEWEAGNSNVLAVMPTGAGKTVTLSSIVLEHDGGAVVIAHRQELVAQLSLALNDCGVRHRIIAPDSVIKLVVQRHLKTHGVTFYDANARVGVGGVDTVVRLDQGKRAMQFDTWRKSVTLWVQDEAHHVLKENKWGKAVDQFPNAKRGLGVTATPGRPDGQGLGRHACGLFDAMVIGPCMRTLINDGYLSPYKIVTVPTDVRYDDVPVGASGEYVQAKLVAVEEGSHLVGDIVGTYLERAAGKRAVCFVSSVARAEQVAQQFRDAGVPAAAVDGKTDSAIREKAMEDLATGALKIVVNCDLIGEGVDIPAVEVVIMGTRTASFIRYTQWFGRMLRLVLSPELREGYDLLDSAGRRARIAASEKPFGLLIDHGGNVPFHKGPPDIPRPWTLDNRERRSSGATDAIPYRVCVNPGLSLLGGSWASWRAGGWSDDMLIAQGLAVRDGLPCAQPYEATHPECPFCGYKASPTSRRAPEHVDGELVELDPDVLEALYARRDEVHRTPGQVREHYARMGLPGTTVERHVKDHMARCEAQAALREAMARFGGIYHARGDTDAQIQRRFYFMFGIDVGTAQGLKRAEADKLRERILTTLS